MGLIKSNKQGKIRIFNEFLEAKSAFENLTNPVDLRIEALDYIIKHKEIFYVLRILSEFFKENNSQDHVFIDYIFANFENKPRRQEDFEMLFKMLKSDNAYLRNAVIMFLRNYGKEAKPFIEELMNSDDKDIRIFAINILGDVRFDESIDMLREFIKKETDINALMTAVDYLGEIGNEDDIALLESIKSRFNNPYVEFGVNLAIDRIKA